MPRDPAAFVRDHVHLGPVPLVPEIQLHQADDPIGLWELNEGEYRSTQPPPFWAFAWAGGQALARYVLDNPAVVASRRVLDLAAGSGLVAVAAAKAGAAEVRAVEIDPLAIAAIELNAAANAVEVTAVLADILDEPPDGAEVVLAGDVFYSKAMADRVLGYLRRCAKGGATVLVGDPERAFLPRKLFHPLTTVEVPVTQALESADIKRSTVWSLPIPAGSHQAAGA